MGARARRKRLERSKQLKSEEHTDAEKEQKHMPEHDSDSDAAEENTAAAQEGALPEETIVARQQDRPRPALSLTPLDRLDELAAGTSTAPPQLPAERERAAPRRATGLATADGSFDDPIYLEDSPEPDGDITTRSPDAAAFSPVENRLSSFSTPPTSIASSSSRHESFPRKGHTDEHMSSARSSPLQDSDLGYSMASLQDDGRAGLPAALLRFKDILEVDSLSELRVNVPLSKIDDYVTWLHKTHPRELSSSAARWALTTALSQAFA